MTEYADLIEADAIRAMQSVPAARLKPENILHEASQIVSGDRQDNYGDIHTSFGQIAAYWDTYINRKIKKVLSEIELVEARDVNFSIDIDAMDVANLMILLKVSRAQNKFDRDSYVDIAGYVACAEKLGGL